jgi:hypothetical protein
MKTSVVAFAIVILVLTGCGRGATESPVTGGFSEVGVKRVIDRPAVQNDLRQLALFYKTCEADYGRVKSVEEFKRYIKRDAPKLVQALEDKVYIVVPNVRGGAGTIVAYEKTPDAAKQHIVAMGDGTISQMSTQQLQAALKKQGS